MLLLQFTNISSPKACLLLGMLLLTGCHQLSKNTRADRAIDEEAIPRQSTLGPSLGEESTELQPVPQHSRPSVPLLPPPAPPSDAARLEKSAPPASADDDWADEEFAQTEEEDLEAEEFFPSSATELAQESLTERVTEIEARLAEAGRLANLRRAAQAEQLPVIVPGPTRLRPVPVKHPALMPVPR